MNDLLEAKLFISEIKTKLLDLTGALYADNLADKQYCIDGLLKVIEYIEGNDITVKELKEYSRKI